MIQIPPQAPIFIHTGYVDFRKGIDGLCGVCKYELSQNPMSGALFAFSNRSRKSLKILVYDSQGFWVFHKRLSRGRFTWWPGGENLCLEVAARELSVLIWNGSPDKSQTQSEWKRVDKR